jgi:hypothetical protein
MQRKYQNAKLSSKHAQFLLHTTIQLALNLIPGKYTKVAGFYFS